MQGFTPMIGKSRFLVGLVSLEVFGLRFGSMRREVEGVGRQCGRVSDEFLSSVTFEATKVSLFFDMVGSGLWLGYAERRARG